MARRRSAEAAIEEVHGLPMKAARARDIPPTPPARTRLMAFLAGRALVTAIVHGGHAAIGGGKQPGSFVAFIAQRHRGPLDGSN